MQAKVIHAYKKWEEINRDLLELSKMKERISDDRDYSGYMKESFQREIEKLSNYRDIILNLKVEQETIPSGTKKVNQPEGKKLYQQNESHFREEIANNPTLTSQKPKLKTERPVYKY